MGSEDLEQSLRAEIEGYVNGRLSGLREEIERLQSQINEAFTRLSERLQSNETQSDAPMAVAISEHLRAARNSGIQEAAAESSRVKASSDLAILKAAVDDIENQHSQAEILNALVNRAASFAPRVAFFVVKNDRATGWRARGLEGTVGDDAIREISLSMSDDTLLSDAARSRRTWSGGPGAHADDHTIFSRFGDEPPQRIVAIPLIARDKAVAVLYADCARQDSDAISLEALETLVRVSGMAVELLAVKQPTATAPAPARAAEPTPAAPPPKPQPPPPPPPAFEPPPVSEPPATTAAAPSYDEPAFPETVPADEEVTSPDVQFGFPGGTGEEVSAQPEAAAPPPPPPAAAPSARRYGAEADLPIEVSEGERRFHNDARRFARLLVSEIKLYNEQKVKEGRVEGDLYSRLREDIDRSRQMYDKRVAPEVAGRYDYFHHELVNTLAEGDAAKLGEGYPGATVST